MNTRAASMHLRISTRTNRCRMDMHQKLLSSSCYIQAASTDIGRPTLMHHLVEHANPNKSSIAIMSENRGVYKIVVFRESALLQQFH